MNTAFKDTAWRIVELRSTSEAREGLTAFLEKRAAAWTLGTAGS
jgi:methylglutaconyl-CoA hydratase